MTLIAMEVAGTFLPPSDLEFSKGKMDMIRLNEPFDGRKYGVLSAETQGRQAVRERLGRLEVQGDPIIIKRFELGAEALVIHEIA